MAARKQVRRHWVGGGGAWGKMVKDMEIVIVPYQKPAQHLITNNMGALNFVITSRFFELIGFP